MLNSSRLRSSLFALCLLPLCAVSCSKEKKEGGETKGEATTETTGVATDPGKVVEAPAGNSKTEPASGALAYLPKDCAIAFHVDIRSVFKNAGVASTILPKIKTSFEEAKKDKGEMAAFFSSTGLNPFTDFHDMGACLTNVPMGGSDPKGMGVVTGTAKTGLLPALLATSSKTDKFKPIKVGGVNGIEADGVMIVQLDDGTLLFGNDKALLEGSFAKPNGQGDAFAAAGKATLRVVVPTSTTKMGFSLPDSPFANFADKIGGSSSFSADLDSRQVTMRIGTTSEESATELSGIAKMLLGSIPKTQGQDVEAQAMAALAAAQVRGEGKAMVGTITFEESTIKAGIEQVANDM